MSGKTTLVIKFGAGASGGFVAAEFDAKKNVDAAGKIKTNYSPGEEVWFLVQHDDTLRIGRVAATGGMIVTRGSVPRSRVDRLDLAEIDTIVELSRIPSGSVTRSWVDNAAAVTIAGRVVSAIGGKLPAKGDFSYTAVMHSFSLIPPPMDLAANETHDITIYIFMEAA